LPDSFKTCIVDLHHPLPNLSDVGLPKVERDAIQGAAAAHNACQCLQVHLLPTQQGKRNGRATTWRRTCSRRRRSRKRCAALARVRRGPWGRSASSPQATDFAAVIFLAFQKRAILRGRNASMAQQGLLSIARHDHLLERAPAMQAKTRGRVLECIART